VADLYDGGAERLEKAFFASRLGPEGRDGGAEFLEPGRNLGGKGRGGLLGHPSEGGSFKIGREKLELGGLFDGRRRLLQGGRDGGLEFGSRS